MPTSIHVYKYHVMYCYIYSMFVRGDCVCMYFNIVYMFLRSCYCPPVDMQYDIFVPMFHCMPGIKYQHCIIGASWNRYTNSVAQRHTVSIKSVFSNICISVNLILQCRCSKRGQLLY